MDPIIDRQYVCVCGYVFQYISMLDAADPEVCMQQHCARPPFTRPSLTPPPTYTHTWPSCLRHTHHPSRPQHPPSFSRRSRYVVRHPQLTLSPHRTRWIGSPLHTVLSRLPVTWAPMPWTGTLDDDPIDSGMIVRKIEVKRFTAPERSYCSASDLIAPEIELSQCWAPLHHSWNLLYSCISDLIVIKR